LRILLIDCSSKKIEFGFRSENSETILTEVNRTGNTDNLLYSLKNFFTENNISLQPSDVIGLSNGPGSFTGLRVSSSIVKGICFASGCRLAETVTLDVIANKINSNKKIIPLIFSNSKNSEYYYSEYVKKNNSTQRISDYRTDFLEDILNIRNSDFAINEKKEFEIPKKYTQSIKDVSDISNLNSLLELTLNKISENDFSDFTLSKPFYMKDFIPNK